MTVKKGTEKLSATTGLQGSLIVNTTNEVEALDELKRIYEEFSVDSDLQVDRKSTPMGEISCIWISFREHLSNSGCYDLDESVRTIISKYSIEASKFESSYDDDTQIEFLGKDSEKAEAKYYFEKLKPVFKHLNKSEQQAIIDSLTSELL